MSLYFSCIHFSFYVFFNAFPPNITLGPWHGVGWGVFICGHGQRAKKWRTVGQQVTYSGPKCDLRGAEKWRTGQNATLECYDIGQSLKSRFNCNGFEMRCYRIVMKAINILYWGLIYYHGLTLIPTWMNNRMNSKVWHRITYSFINSSGATLKVRNG